jgi:preprotein translocase subunit YajC
MSLLDFLVSPAHAQAAAAPKAFGLDFMIPMGVMLVIFYFMLIRPQMRRTKEVKQMMAGLSKGDEALTTSGIAGRITTIGENYVTLEVAEGVAIKVQKSAISSVLPKGTLKAL